MEILVCYRTYNGYGGHPSLTPSGDYLLLDAPSFGTAVQEIEVTIHFRSDGPPRKTLEDMYERFHARLNELPEITFRRKKQKAEVAFYSELMTAREVEKSRQVRLDLFCKTCREVADGLSLLRQRIRKDDDFSLEAFQAWIDQRLDALPTSIEELVAIKSEIESRRKTARESMTEWEKLGIDFNDFHPDARTVLDDRRLWDSCDEWSPNGNDTGADVLELYREWKKPNPTLDARIFFSDLMGSWGVTSPPNTDDEYSVHTYTQAAVGLAFAQLKLHAKCDPKIAAMALDSLDNQADNELSEQLKGILSSQL